MEQIKTQITDYWTKRVDGFSALRKKELTSDMHLRWLAEFQRYLPEGIALDILDIGTGTGFFCFLLASQGHRMTGIDLTEGMIAEAGRTAVQLGIPAQFQVMDAEAPDFPPHSFDAIVTRNLTWNLPHLEQAYRAWHRVLKPGGILINFDADYCREEKADNLPENHAHKNIGADMMQKYEDIKTALRPGQLPRPQWDAALLAAAGFRDIRVDTDVWQRIYREKDEFYNPTPIFTITARA